MLIRRVTRPNSVTARFAIDVRFIRYRLNNVHCNARVTCYVHLTLVDIFETIEKEPFEFKERNCRAKEYVSR